MSCQRLGMLKIRALNESSSSSEDEDEDNPRLSAEAQEAHAKILYEKAQRLTINKEFEQAVDTFGEVLQLPYLTEVENKLSPVQLQLRLGCLKCLSSLYTRGSTKNLEDAAVVLELITEMEPKNVNFWYRLGKVALELKDLELAFDAFKCALDCSPGHWGSIEHLVTVSFALHDLIGCLRFCAIGLNKDPGFVKGHVFKNQVFETHSWTKEAVKGNKQEFETLFSVKVPPGYSDSFGQKYLTEARDIIEHVSQKKADLRKQEESDANKPINCPFVMKSFTLLELGKVVFEVYQHCKDSGTLLRPVDIFSAQREVLLVEEIPPVNTDCEDEPLSCASVCLRSRSTSDDKEPARNNSGNDSMRPANDSSQLSETDDKMAEDDSQSVLQTQGTMDEDNCQRKNKNKKDVKWWQIEGQRRSQRVRGNLVSAPIKVKPESTFAEILRNIIPEALLTDDSNGSKAEDNFRHRKSSLSAPRPHDTVYFGTTEETRAVKMLLRQWKSVDILGIITQFVRWMSKNCRTQWPSDLRAIFLKLYQLYRNSVFINITIDTVEESQDVYDDMFAVLLQAELNLDSNIADATTIFLLDNVTKYLNSDDELLLRLEWLKFRTHCQCQNGLIDNTYYAKLHLDLILNILKQKPDGYKCILPTEHDSEISFSVVQEKLQFVKKIENLSKIEELYQAKQFQDLVEILNFSLSSADSPGDVQNRFYLAESYYRLGNMECVEQCEILLKSVAKCGSEDQLIAVLKLLHNIYDGMKNKMTTNEFKKIINMLLKTLIQVEKQEECSNIYIMTDPWCFLHKVLYQLEQMESAFAIDEETVPGSILILQLGHEMLSKIGKCSINNGSFLSYSINAILEMESSDFYWSFDETKNCLDQAILCLYGHPNIKKFKLKNLKDHETMRIPMTWAACCQLYNYYKLEELPEFDSKPNKSISAEVENLFQRIITDMPPELKPIERYHQMKEYVKGCTKTADPFELQSLEILETFDIYYLLADYYFKNQDLIKAVEFYTWDLAVCPLRFDSWTAIALTKVEGIVSKINACDAYKIEEIMKESDAVIRCFKQSSNLDLGNTKVRIEFGSFLYSLQSVFSRELKFHASKITPEIAKEVETRYSTYLLQSQGLFEPYKMGAEGAIIADQADEDDAWINHYMLGKVAEKTHPTQPEKFLSQYTLASQLLHAKCSVYPSRINYYNPQDYALEALEVYFRIHASVLRYIQKVKDYNQECEEMLLKFLTAAEESPFIKSKQGRATDGESKKRKKTAAEDATVSKKDMVVINSVMKQMLEKVVKMTSKVGTAGSVPSSSSNSSAEITSSSDEDSNAIPTAPSTSSVMKNLSLSSFRDRLREEEADKTFPSSKAKHLGVTNQPTRQTPCPTTVEKNPYFKDFGSLPYGLVISICLKAMKECVSRCPQYFKAFYRLSHAFVTFKNDFKKAKEYLMGNNTGKGGGKVAGLYGERKPSNFFNGIWRHPIEDIDRPGSFAFYMSKSMQLLLDVLCELNDHKMLADVGTQLSKIPDSKNTYLYTEDREQYSINAFKLCEKAARKSIPKNPNLLLDCGLAIYDTYTKFQKLNSRENNIAPVLLDIYKQHIAATMQGMSSDVSLGNAVRFFHILWNRNATGLGNVTDYSPRTLTTYGPGVNAGVPNLKSVASLSQIEKSSKSSQRQPDTQREQFGQQTPYTIPGIDFNSSVAATDLMLAAQLATFNNALHQQYANYFNHQSAVDAINSNNMTANSNKQNKSLPKQSPDENVKKMQKNSLKLSNPFHSPMPLIRDQIISNLTNSMNRKAGIERSRAIKYAHKRFAASVLSKANNQSSLNQATAASAQQGQSGKNRIEMTPKLPQHQQAEFNCRESNMSNSTTSPLLDFPNISCTKLLPKLHPKPVQARKLQPNTNAAPQKSKANTCTQSFVSSSYVSSSPFQVCQATAMTNPALPGRYSPMTKNTSQQSSQSNSSSPQPAHSQAVTEPRYSVNSTLPAYSQPNRMYPRLTSSTPQPEVVDLTTKSPDKSTNQSSQSISTSSGLNIPTASNPKQSYTHNQTSVTMNKPRIGVKPPSSINSSHLMPTEFKQSQEMTYKSAPFASKPHTSIKPTVQISHSKSMQMNSPRSLFAGANTGTGFYKSSGSFNSSLPIVSITPIPQPQDLWNSCSSQNVATPKINQNMQPNTAKSAPTAASRQLKRPLQMTEKGHHYPLPPKKKHHIIPTSPVPVDLDPDVERSEQDATNSSCSYNCDIPKTT